MEKLKMTVNEARERIENELKAVTESFGDAKSLVKYNIDVEVNVIEGAPENAENDYPEDITEHVNMLIESGLDRMSAMKTAAKQNFWHGRRCRFLIQTKRSSVLLCREPTAERCGHCMRLVR